MKVLVSVKRVPDPDVKAKLKKDKSGVDTENVKFVVNPFDEIAVEEGLRIKEKHGGEVVVASIGGKESTEQLRTALAMGADRAILVLSDKPLDSYNVAVVFSKLYEMEKPDLIIMGKQAVDDDSNQAAQMLAEILKLPQATFAYRINFSQDLKKAEVIREVDGGLETVEVELPAVITADLRLNEPRYASLPGIMKAKSKPLKEIPIQELGIEVKPRIEITELDEPPKRKGGRKVESVDELVDKLHNEAKVI
jgi:electron transfer flavoprotein beta subunit